MSAVKERASRNGGIPEQPPREGSGSGRGLWRPAVLLLAIVAVLIAARLTGVGDRLGELRGWIESLGTLGYLVFAGIYVVSVVAALPGSAMSVAAGALFGSILGVILVSIAATVGAALAFLISRYFARDAVAHWLSGNEKFRRLDRLTAEHGAIIVALTRLVPIFPFNLLNYGFGLTRVPFWTYLFWSWLCMLPATVLFVVGADAVTEAIAGGTIPWLLVVLLAIVAAVLALLVRVARRKLQKKQSEENRVHG